MAVRRADGSDAESIAEVHVRSWQGAYRGLLPDDYLQSLSVERRTRMWTHILADPRVDVFVALNAQGQIVGFATLQVSRDSDAVKATGEVTAIYVLPSEWGRGIGRALMEAALKRARERGFRCVTLWVLAANNRARRFYEKAGFVRDGAEKTDTLSHSIVLQEVRYRIDLA